MALGLKSPYLRHLRTGRVTASLLRVFTPEPSLAAESFLFVAEGVAVVDEGF